jgi:hypothetical protein
MRDVQAIAELWTSHSNVCEKVMPWPPFHLPAQHVKCPQNAGDETGVHNKNCYANSRLSCSRQSRKQQYL